MKQPTEIAQAVYHLNKAGHLIAVALAKTITGRGVDASRIEHFRRAIAHVEESSRSLEHLNLTETYENRVESPDPSYGAMQSA